LAEFLQGCQKFAKEKAVVAKSTVEPKKEVQSLCLRRLKHCGRTDEPKEKKSASSRQ
jgi:predicted Fe-S protein YdhL (DUF1289 family)